MDCKRASDLMMVYLDGELKVNEKMEFCKHMKMCSSCFEELESLEEAISYVEELEDFQAPDNFEAKILDSIDLKKFAPSKRRMPKPLNIGVILLAISLSNILIYLKFGTVDTTAVYRYLTSLTVFINFTTIVNRFIGLGYSAMVDWMGFLADASLYFKGLIGIYFIILMFLGVFFVGIHLTLIKLTTGQRTKGGNIYEK